MQATRLTEIVGNVLYILSKSNVFERKRYAEIVQDKHASNEKREYHITGGCARGVIRQVQRQLWDALATIRE